MESNKIESLRRNSDFLDLRNSGRRMWVSSWMLFNFRSSDGNLRVGFTVSRKIGTAVVRNRLKRWSREQIRKFQNEGERFNGDVNIILKPMQKDFYKNISRTIFSESLSKGWQRIRKI